MSGAGAGAGGDGSSTSADVGGGSTTSTGGSGTSGSSSMGSSMTIVGSSTGRDASGARDGRLDVGVRGGEGEGEWSSSMRGEEGRDGAVVDGDVGSVETDSGARELRSTKREKDDPQQTKETSDDRNRGKEIGLPARRKDPVLLPVLSRAASSRASTLRNYWQSLAATEEHPATEQENALLKRLLDPDETRCRTLMSSRAYPPPLDPCSLSSHPHLREEHPLVD